MPLVHFAQEYGLQSMLPAGTITWQHVGIDRYSSIDVIMASAGLAAQLIRCSVHKHDHGPDHQPIVGSTSTFAVKQGSRSRVAFSQKGRTGR